MGPPEDTSAYDALLAAGNPACGSCIAGTCSSSGASCSSGPGSAAPNQTLTQWLNANSTMVTVGAALFAGVLMLMGRGRR